MPGTQDTKELVKEALKKNEAGINADRMSFPRSSVTAWISRHAKYSRREVISARSAARVLGSGASRIIRVCDA